MIGKEQFVEPDRPYPEYSSQVQAVVSDSGPIDLLYQHQHNRLRTVVERLVGRPPDSPNDAEYKSASPCQYVAANVAPIMLIYGESDDQVPIETADEFTLALGRAGHSDVSYHRLGKVAHCPHSLIKVPWLVPAVNEFFVRRLRGKGVQ